MEQQRRYSSFDEYMDGGMDIVRNMTGKERLAELGQKVLEAAKQELFMSMRYLFAPLNQLEFNCNQMISFLATDGSSLYYNPIRLIEKYKESQTAINRAYLHTVFHCLFKHVYTGGDKDKDIWDLACDIAVSYLIDGIELSCVMALENPDREKVYKLLEERCPVMSAGNIYYVLMRHMKADTEKLIASNMFYVDDHSFWVNNDKQKQDKNDKTRQDSENDQKSKQWDDVAKQMQTALMSGQGRGDSKGKLRRALGARTHSQMSYRDFLKRFTTIRENMHIDMDSFDYGFYNYGIEVYGNMPLIEENEYREESGIEDFVIVLDTSGSCAFDLLERFVDVTFDVISGSESFFDKMNLHIIQCDNEVQEDAVIKSKDDIKSFRESFEAKGFGGTDFRPAFQYVDSLRQKGTLKKLKGLLYFTDGYGVYPSKRPDYDAAFVFLGEYDADRKVPGWAIRLDISEEQLL